MEKVYESKNFGKFKILGKGRKYGYLSIQFLETGNTDEFRKDAVLKGEIRDKYAKTFLGIGVIGNVKTRGKNKRAYLIWRNMLIRCYKKDSKSANSYYKRVSVSTEWLVFERFLNDMKDIDGWDEKMFRDGKIVLDKDKKQRFQAKKVYSKQTCSWLLASENNKYQDFQQKEFIAESPDGETFRDYNISDFARRHGLGRRQVSAVLHNRFKSTLGWKFKFLDKDIV